MSVHSLPKEVLIAITRNFVSNKTNDSLVIERKKKIFVKKYNGFFSDFMEKMYGEKYYEKFLKMAEDYIKKLEVFRMEKYEEISIEQIQKIVSKQKLEVKQENSKVVIPLSFKDLKIVYPFSLNEYIYILDYFLYYKPKEFKCEIVVKIDIREVIKSYIQLRGNKQRDTVECDYREEKLICYIENIEESWLNRLVSSLKRWYNIDSKIVRVIEKRNRKNAEIEIISKESLEYVYKSFRVLNIKEFITSFSWITNNFEKLIETLAIESEKHIKNLGVI